MSLKALRRDPQAGVAADSLVVLLHGIGADGQDLIGLAEPLSDFLPNAAFVAPDGPEPTGLGRQWFERAVWAADKPIPAERAKTSAPILNAFLDEELARLKLPPDRLALVGFSQGSMMALRVGLHREPPPAAIVGISGALMSADTFPQTTHNRAPVLLIHGVADDVVPVARMAEAEAGLRQAGVPAETFPRPGVGHWIDEAGIEATGRFLKTKLSRG